ncbi:MAG: hypothetical protein IPO28_03275 [Holophagaceae bacterium]|nr:hypothetical protein [Holophagaceae bacterium]
MSVPWPPRRRTGSSSDLHITEEGREQPFLVITSPANLKRLEDGRR